MASLKKAPLKKSRTQTQPTVQRHQNGRRPLAFKGPLQTLVLLNIGHGSYIATHKLIAVLNSNSSPVKRLVHEAKKAKTLKDATHGRKSRSVLIMENGDIILSALNPDTMALRFDHREIPRT